MFYFFGGVLFCLRNKTNKQCVKVFHAENKQAVEINRQITFWLTVVALERKMNEGTTTAKKIATKRGEGDFIYYTRANGSFFEHNNNNNKQKLTHRAYRGGALYLQCPFSSPAHICR